MPELLDSILKLDLKDGDILFIDCDAVDMTALASAEWPPKLPKVLMVAVNCAHGKSVQDSIFSMPREQAEEILKSIAEK